MRRKRSKPAATTPDYSEIPGAAEWAGWVKAWLDEMDDQQPPSAPSAEIIPFKKR